MSVLRLLLNCSTDMWSGTSCRCISTSSTLLRLSAGKHRTTPRKTKMLTYEMAQRPEHVGVRKSWLTWHTSNLEGFGLRQGQVVAEDEIVRRFTRGIFPEIFVSEIIIKRRGNVIVVAGLVQQKLTIRKIYWLLGFAEELLSNLLKQPVKYEIQSVPNKTALAYTYV